MSRVAKRPIALPKGVELNIQSENVSVKGPKGTLSIDKPAGIDVKIEDGQALLSAANDELVPLTGTLRAIIANMVQGAGGHHHCHPDADRDRGAGRRQAARR